MTVMIVSPGQYQGVACPYYMFQLPLFLNQLFFTTASIASVQMRALAQAKLTQAAAISTQVAATSSGKREMRFLEDPGYFSRKS